ncbi:Hypothetical protein NTJ_12596 [Nesidiocoris tenuis]|uniref:Zasp-like motif domain-containing protein n=1 Tax=Nesidiocoris tenuis TaxID=355587 RepID=A0ABN7B810_9HEMI|nr:Hypothetical protein NTJ_12596 [Nesidiocoris tenuis]
MAALNVIRDCPGIRENYEQKDNSTTEQQHPWTSLENICSYKTSSQIAHQFRRPPSLFHEPPGKVPSENLETDLTLKNAVHQTTYRHDFDLKFKKEDVMRNADRPAFRKFQFMQIPSERLKFKGHRHFITTMSESSDKFRANGVERAGEPPAGRLQDFSARVHCQEVGPTKGYRPLVPLDVESAAKYVDPYVSTAQMDFDRKTDEKLEKINSPVYFPKSMFPAAKSMREKAQTDAVLYRSQPKRLEPMISTTHENFRYRRLPVDPKPPYDVLTFRQTLGDAIRTAGMYHTEYDHIGSSWHSDVLVDHQ